MKQIKFVLIALAAILVLIIAIPAVLGEPADNKVVFFNEESLLDGSNTTFVTPSTDEMMLISSFTIKDRDLKQQIQESTIIVKGRVIEILDTVITKDLVAPVLAEQGSRLHTDVLFQVDEYLGPNSLPFEKIVLRRMGGKIEGLTHVVEQENLTVGEDLIIFRLSQPELMTQVPEGYSREQYFMFNPASKFVSIGGEKYRASFKNTSYDTQQIKKAITRDNPGN